MTECTTFVSASTDVEALALVMNVLQRIADTALDGFKGDGESSALSDINNISRNTIDALANRRLLAISPAPQTSDARALVGDIIRELNDCGFNDAIDLIDRLTKERDSLRLAAPAPGVREARAGGLSFARQTKVARKQTHKALLGLRDRAARQPISYKPLFDETVDIIAADLRHQLCATDAAAPRMREVLRFILAIVKREWEFAGAHPHRAALIKQAEAALASEEGK